MKKDLAFGGVFWLIGLLSHLPFGGKLVGCQHPNFQIPLQRAINH